MEAADSAKIRRKRLLGIVILCVSTLALVVLIALRKRNSHPAFSFRRSADQPSGSDPSMVVPQYSNLVFQLKARHFNSISNLTVADLTRINSSLEVKLSSEQHELLFRGLLDLVLAHQTGNSNLLHNVLFPFSDQAGVGWSSYAQHRLPIILASDGLRQGDVENIMSTATWQAVQQAWSIMVRRFQLTNWWEAVSLEQSSLWVHHRQPKDFPAPDSENYGQFAGTVVGPSLLTYDKRFASDSADSKENTLAAVRLVVRFHQREKPIIYVFRWGWSPKRRCWLPVDRCIGVVGGRLPDPFF